MDEELQDLIDGLIDADEVSNKMGYLEELTPEQHNKLMSWLLKEVGAELRRGDH